MKFRGPGSSLHPAREAARIQARKVARASGKGTGGSGGGGSTSSGGVRLMSTSSTTSQVMSTMSAPTEAAQDWRIHVDDATGALVATHEPTGVATVLATPTDSSSSDSEGGV